MEQLETSNLFERLNKNGRTLYVLTPRGFQVVETFKNMKNDLEDKNTSFERV